LRDILASRALSSPDIFAYCSCSCMSCCSFERGVFGDCISEYRAVVGVVVAPPDAVCFSVMMLSSNIASSKMTVGVLRSGGMNAAPALTVLGSICPDATPPVQHPIEGATADSNPRFNSKIFHHGFSFPLFAMLGVDGESSEWCCVRRSFESLAISVPALCGIRQVCRFVLLFQGGEAISKGQNSKSATGLYSFHWRLTSALCLTFTAIQHSLFSSTTDALPGL